jgi:hypothetical protein
VLTVLAIEIAIVAANVGVLTWLVIKQFSWLKQTLIPWMVSISNHVNPDHL